MLILFDIERLKEGDAKFTKYCRWRECYNIMLNLPEQTAVSKSLQISYEIASKWTGQWYHKNLDFNFTPTAFKETYILRMYSTIYEVGISLW